MTLHLHRRLLLIWLLLPGLLLSHGGSWSVCLCDVSGCAAPSAGCASAADAGCCGSDGAVDPDGDPGGDHCGAACEGCRHIDVAGFELNLETESPTHHGGLVPLGVALAWDSSSAVPPRRWSRRHDRAPPKVRTQPLSERIGTMPMRI